ncbi:polyprotein [Acara virus]|uniref:Envelopment polyprotein n=1 Tax=Acara virus TaxID=2748201 RepID=A0A7D9MW15_9VIRU|nr:polyprotein [Acara virus]QLA47107.1 polyprotein [Acara virus]
MILIALIAILKLASALPVGNRCFADGVISAVKQMEHGLAEICIKDDISMVKTTSVQIRNTSKFMNTVYRKMLVQNYEQCNPVETANGPIMIFKPNEELMLIPHTFACRVSCTISLDEEEANIILHSDKLNHYEVMGTTTANRWFQGTTSYSLEHTCEHIQVTCGSTSLSFHACFKYHMACIRLLNRSYMPAFMIQSVCQNKELILMGCLVLIIFGLLYVMTLTYICYIMIPIFYPIAYIYGVIYNRSCKKCNYCGLAYHPLTKCGKNCVCGCMFENSERMKMHRESGLCRGYKSLRAARILCKNRGSSFILAVILSFLLLSFIQPIEGIKLKYRGEDIELDSVVEEFEMIYDKLNYAHNISIVYGVITALMITIIGLLAIFKSQIKERFYRSIVYHCHECDMTHPKRDLTFIGDFTNKCNTCMCGCNYTNLVDESDYMIPMTHKKNIACVLPGRYYALRRYEVYNFRLMIAFLLFIFGLSVANADTCTQIVNNQAITNPIQCSVWSRLPTSCSEVSNIIEAFKNIKLTQQDKSAIQKLPNSLESMLIESERMTLPVSSFLMESGALKVHCKELIDAGMKTGTLNNKLAQIFIKDPLEICEKHKMIDVCKCLRNEPGCSTTGSMTGATDHYKANIEVFKSDILKVIKALIQTYHGIFAKEFALSIKLNNFTKTKELAGKMKDKFKSADAANACIVYLEKMLAESQLEKVNPQANIGNDIQPYETATSKLFENLSDGQSTKVCQSPKIYRCNYLFSMKFRFLVTCGGHANIFYDVPDEGFAPKMNAPNQLCLLDPYCDKDYVPLKAAEKEELKSLRCIEVSNPSHNFTRFDPIDKCHKISAQTCEYHGKTLSFVECKNGFFYEYKKLFQSGKDDIGTYCLSQDCKTTVYPHHVKNLQGCSLHVHNLETRKLKEIIYENIEQLKHSLQETIKTDLIEHKYLLTMNLPKITPSFKALSVSGVETDSGVESAYIETNIVVRTGVSTGISLTTKKGEPLFDIVLFIKSAHYEADAQFQYNTGPTIGINVQHDELCTGHCPENLKQPGWLSFSKEHTSAWGCEEFGCLAINEGCLFGHCRDIIKPEIRVFSRGSEGVPKVTLCINTAGESFCHEISSFTPIITEKLEVQFLSNEASRIPKVFAYKSNKVLTGMINEKGSFSKMCGSVQSFNNTVWGAGNVKFDFICHAARRKDVTVSRCFDNFYEACQLLSQEPNLVFDDKTNKVLQLNRLMGEMRVKIKLGDIRYKVFESKPSLDIKSTCVGCINCIKGMDCELSIVATTDTVCPIKSTCTLHMNNIFVESTKQKYGIKAICTDGNIEFTVCDIQTSAQVTFVERKDVIEIGNSDQTYFVKEKDLRCGTWLCKISEQGISSLFTPFISIFGSYGKIAFYTILVILCLALVIFLMLPICVKFKDVLKRNEIEYIKENFGYKPISYRR